MFIAERLDNNLSELTEKETKGRGGKREGAGRPTGSTKEPKKRIYVPCDIAEWLKKPESIVYLRHVMHTCQQSKRI